MPWRAATIPTRALSINAACLQFTLHLLRRFYLARVLQMGFFAAAGPAQLFVATHVSSAVNLGWLCSLVLLLLRSCSASAVFVASVSPDTPATVKLQSSNRLAGHFALCL